MRLAWWRRRGSWVAAATLNEDYEVRAAGQWLRVLAVSKEPRAPTRFVKVHMAGRLPACYLTEALLYARRAR